MEGDKINLMSGICGIIQFDDAPVEPGLFTKMVSVSAYQGQDGVTQWQVANAALAHLVLNTTPEAKAERQPLFNQQGSLVLVADAVIYNRPELIQVLATKAEPGAHQLSDAELILSAYERWGEACADQIVGDFAFVVWDRQRQALFCARDAMGRGRFIILSTGISSALAATWRR